MSRRDAYASGINKLIPFMTNRCEEYMSGPQFRELKKSIEDMGKGAILTIHNRHMWNSVGIAVSGMLHEISSHSSVRYPKEASQELILCGHVHHFLQDAGLVDGTTSLFPDATNFMKNCFQRDGRLDFYYHWTNRDEFHHFHNAYKRHAWEPSRT